MRKIELALTTLWMAGIVMGWDANKLWHLVAAAVIALVCAEGTEVERRVVRVVLRRR